MVSVEDLAHLMPNNKKTSHEIRVVEGVHPYTMLDSDLPIIISLIYQILTKEGIAGQKPLFVIYSDDEEKPEGKRPHRKKQK
jgi:hypothetical protein